MLQISLNQTSDALKIIDDLQKIYVDVSFSLYQSDDRLHFITCFVAKFPSAASCAEEWENVNSSIALAAQEVMHADVAPWNLYLLICTPDTLPKHLKYKIENDRFAARKITIIKAELPVDATDAYKNVLENLILGRDLKLMESAPEVATKLKSDVETSSQQKNEASAIRDFILRKDELIPQDRKPVSGLLRKQYIEDLIKITVKS